jgi:hypothetical protein
VARRAGGKEADPHLAQFPQVAVDTNRGGSAASDARLARQAERIPNDDLSPGT